MSNIKNKLFETETDIKLEPPESLNSNKETSWSFQVKHFFSFIVVIQYLQQHVYFTSKYY